MGGSVIGANAERDKKSGFENTSATRTSTSMPVIPEGWEGAWNAMGQSLSPDGFTATQRSAVDWLAKAMGNADPAGLGATQTQLGDAAAQWKDIADNRSSNTLATLATRYPDFYKPLEDVRAAQVSTQDVTAQDIEAGRGAAFMRDYQNPFMRDVVDASLADYDVGASEARTALRAGNAGAFGNKRTGVAEGQFAADSALGRSKLAADLRAGGFNTAAALGMQDADRTLAADQANQSANLQAAMTNAANRLTADQFNVGNDMAAQQFNNTMQNQREMFDIDAGYRGYEMRDNARRAYENTLNTQAALGLQNLQTGADLAQGLLGAGGVGPAQNLAWLGAGTPLFGESSTGSQNVATTSGSRSSSKGGNISGITVP